MIIYNSIITINFISILYTICFYICRIFNFYDNSFFIIRKSIFTNYFYFITNGTGMKQAMMRRSPASAITREAVVSGTRSFRLFG